MKRLRSERGLLSLEASIAVTIFLFLMLFMYSYFIVFEARNEIAHVLLATTNSLSLDPYGSESVQDSGAVGQFISLVYHISQDSYGRDEPGEGFVNMMPWTRALTFGIDENTWDGSLYVPGEIPEADEYGNAGAESELLGSVVKARFVAYLAGGDEAAADRILKRFHVVNGLDGLDFSGTHVASSKIYVNVRYTLEYEYKVFNLGTMSFEQSACSKLWE